MTPSGEDSGLNRACMHMQRPFACIALPFFFFADACMQACHLIYRDILMLRVLLEGVTTVEVREV